VEVHGKRVRAEELTYLLLHKPVGVVTTLDDPEGRPTIVTLLPADGARVFPVGRLDFNTEGALLCTNDGELAHALTHPSRHVPKRYLVRVRGTVSEQQLEALGNGVDLEDGRTARTKVLVRAETRGHTWLDITVHEGRNRLIRRMCEVLELTIMRLLRSEFAGLTVEGLPPGAYRELSTREIGQLRATAGLERKTIRSGRGQTSGSKPPGRKAPGRKAPSRKAPERKAPERKAPERKAPGRKAPERKAPGRRAPGRKAPDRRRKR
jgi:23S rRNA pseudouridine2605 synthase